MHFPFNSLQQVLGVIFLALATWVEQRSGVIVRELVVHMVLN